MDDVQKNKLYSSLSLLCFNVFLASLLVVVLSYFSVLSLDVLVNSDLVFGFGIFLGFLSLVLWENSKGKWILHFEHKNGSKSIKAKEVFDGNLFFRIVPCLFLLMLLIIALNQFFRWNFVNSQMMRITILAITFGAITFWRNKDGVEKEIEEEKSQEGLAEKERYEEFDDKFPGLSKLNLEYGFVYAGKIKSLFRRFLAYLIIAVFSPLIFLIRLPYNLVKWMYKEGWWYGGALIGIVILGIVLRVWNMYYLQGADNYNILAAKSLYENGFFVYPGEKQITYFIFYSFKLFGSSLATARIPMVFMGSLSVGLIYFLGKMVGKKVGLLSSFLLAILPMAIEEDGFMRPYSEDFLISLSVSLILIKLFLYYNSKPRKFMTNYILFVSIISTIILIYNYVMNIGTVMGILFNILLISIPISIFFVKDNFQKFFVKFIFCVAIVSILFLLIFPKVWTLLTPAIVYNPYWFNMFFNPMVKTPMQWFSFSGIGAPFLLALFLLALFFNYKHKRIIMIMHFIFWATIFIFVFKYNGVYNHARYLYYIFPFYIVLFSTGIFYFMKSIRVSFKKLKNLVLVLAILFFLSSVIIPQNTLHGADHDLSIWSLKNSDSRQPTDAGNRNFYYEIFDFLENNNFSKRDAMVVVGENQFYITWHFNYPITRSYTSVANISYDAGDRVYVVDRGLGVNEFAMALKENNEGYLLDSSWNYPKNDFNYYNKTFKYLGDPAGYRVYFWN